MSAAMLAVLSKQQLGFGSRLVLPAVLFRHYLHMSECISKIC